MKQMLKSLFFLLLAFNISFVFAGTIDHFQVEFSKPSAMQFEALDITIKAVDKNNDIVTDYTGNILAISESDDEVELPEDLASDNGYTFQLSDQGVKKFENGVKFSNIGEQVVSVYDSDDYQNLIGKGEINILKAPTSTKKIEIEILTPETNTTITKNYIQLSGKTKKNHQVKIELNNNTNYTTTSNSDGIFQKDIDNLTTGNNTFKAYVLDADENIIGESSSVIIKVNDNKPIFKKIILSPLSKDGSVEEGTNIDVKVFASSKLKTVKLLFNDGVVALSETENGIYTSTFKAPNEEKQYKIDIILVDNLGHIVTEKNSATINVTLVEQNSATGSLESIKTITCSGSNVKISELKINGLKVIKLKNKSILTWDKVQKAESYDIYKKNESGKFDFIKNIKIPKFEINITGDKVKYQYFAVKAKAKGCEKNELISGNLSEATQIQTGPTEIFLMLLLSLILGFGFMIIKRKKIIFKVF